MTTIGDTTTKTDPRPLDDDPDAVRLAGAFLAGYASPATRHAKADTTVGYDQSDQSFHRDPIFVLMSATAR